MALSHFAWLRVSSLLLLLLAVPGVAVAEMLDEPACKSLKEEQAKLAAEGLKTEMLHGPDWAKANLPTSRLDQIKHLMEVEENIAFRCPLPPPPKPVEPVAATPAGQDPNAASDQGTAKPAKKKARKKRDGDGAAATAESAPAEAPPAPAKKKQKAKKKPEQTNDAYVPPPASGNAFVDGEADAVPQPATQQLAP